jgi:amino-acid N-acetyltransferase
MIRKAKVSEVPEIYRMLAEFARNHEWAILPRKMAELYSLVRDYFVCREDRGPIRGIAALHIFWEDWGEIRSLAVEPSYQDRGIGSRLVASCLAEARDLGLKKVFVLTSLKQADFFQRLGFDKVPKGDLPPIIWAECANCLKYPACDEIPMLNVLEAAAGRD